MSSLSVSSVKSFMLRARVITPPHRPIKQCERMCLCVTSAVKIHSFSHSGCSDLFDILVCGSFRFVIVFVFVWQKQISAQRTARCLTHWCWMMVRFVRFYTRIPVLLL